MLLSGKCLKIAKDHETKEKTIAKQQEDSVENTQQVVTETKDVPITNDDIKATSLVASIKPETSGDHVLSEPINQRPHGWTTNDEDNTYTNPRFKNQVSDIYDLSTQFPDESHVVNPADVIVPTLVPSRVPPTRAAVQEEVQPLDKVQKQQTTPPVTIFKMKIIQTVVNSNVDQDSEKKIQHTVRVETPATKNDISVNIEHTSKNIDNVGSGLQSSVVPNQDTMTRERMGILDRKPPTISNKEDSSDSIEDVVHELTPIPEMEIIHPNQEDEVKSILSVYDNVTSTKDSSSSEEVKIQGPKLVSETETEVESSESVSSVSEQSEESFPAIEQTSIEQGSESSSEQTISEIKTTAKSNTSTKPPFRISEKTTTKAPNLRSPESRHHKGSGSSGSRTECSNVLVSFFASLIYFLLIT